MQIDNSQKYILKSGDLIFNDLNTVVYLDVQSGIKSNFGKSIFCIIKAFQLNGNKICQEITFQSQARYEAKLDIRLQGNKIVKLIIDHNKSEFVGKDQKTFSFNRADQYTVSVEECKKLGLTVRERRNLKYELVMEEV